MARGEGLNRIPLDSVTPGSESVRKATQKDEDEGLAEEEARQAIYHTEAPKFEDVEARYKRLPKRLRKIIETRSQQARSELTANPEKALIEEELGGQVTTERPEDGVKIPDQDNWEADEAARAAALGVGEVSNEPEVPKEAIDPRWSALEGFKAEAPDVPPEPSEVKEVQPDAQEQPRATEVPSAKSEEDLAAEVLKSAKDEAVDPASEESAPFDKKAERDRRRERSRDLLLQAMDDLKTDPNHVLRQAAQSGFVREKHDTVIPSKKRGGAEIIDSYESRVAEDQAKAKLAVERQAEQEPRMAEAPAAVPLKKVTEDTARPMAEEKPKNRAEEKPRTESPEKRPASAKKETTQEKKPEVEPVMPEAKDVKGRAAERIERIIKWETSEVEATWLKTMVTELREGNLSATEISSLTHYFEAYQTRLTIIEETTRRGGGEVSQASRDEVAQAIDDLYKAEDYLNKVQTFDERHADVLKAFYESIKDQTAEIAPEDFGKNLGFIKNERALLAARIDQLREAPNPAANSEEIIGEYHRDELAKVLETYDKLIAGLEGFNPNKESQFETEITLIKEIITELELLTLEQAGEGNGGVGAESTGEGGENPEILIADVSEVVKAMAWRIAENRLNEILQLRQTENNTGGFISRMLRSMDARLGKKGYLDKFYDEAQQEIESNQDLRRTIIARLHGESDGDSLGIGDKSETYEVLDAIIEQMKYELLEDGERGRVIPEMTEHFSNLFQRHIEGEFTNRAEFEAASREVIQGLIEQGIINPEDFGGEERSSEAVGQMFASNLWEIAEGNKEKVFARFEKMGESLTEEQKKEISEKFLASMGRLDVRLAAKFADIEENRAQRPDKTNPYLGRLERALGDFSRVHPTLGAFVSPPVLGLGTSYGIGFFAKTAITGAAAAGGILGLSGMFGPLLIGVGVGATIAGFRRSRDVKYDRGMEQRREALGVQGEGNRAAELRERGFGDFARNAQDLIEKINAGDNNAALEAEARLQLQRELREVRPVDLIYVDAEESERTGTNVSSMTQLKVALAKFKEEFGIDDDRVADMVSDLRDNVARQDGSFEQYRRGQALVAAGQAALYGAILGILGNELGDRVSEHFNGGTNDRISLMEYLGGQRPEKGAVAYFAMGDKRLPDGAVHHEQVTLPGSKAQVEVGYKLIGNNGNPRWEVQAPELPKGYTFNSETGEITHSVSGVRGTTGQDGWLETRNNLADRFGFDRMRASWLKHATNGTSPIGGDSYSGGDMRANGSELEMEFVRQKDNSVVVSIERALGHAAFGDGHRVTLSPENMDDFVATISPHVRADSGGQHDALALMFDAKGHSQPIPAEMADQIFAGNDLKNNMMVTVNEVIGQDHGKTRLFEVMADYGSGDSGIIDIPGHHESTVIPTPELPVYHQAVQETIASAPSALPFNNPWTVGNPIPKSAEEEVEKDTALESGAVAAGAGLAEAAAMSDEVAIGAASETVGSRSMGAEDAEASSGRVILPNEAQPGNPEDLIIAGQTKSGNPEDLIIPGKDEPGNPEDLIIPGQSEPGNPEDLITPGVNDREPNSIDNLIMPESYLSNAAERGVVPPGAEAILKAMDDKESDPQEVMIRAIRANFVRRRADGLLEPVGEWGARIRDAYQARIARAEAAARTAAAEGASESGAVSVSQAAIAGGGSVNSAPEVESQNNSGQLAGEPAETASEQTVEPAVAPVPEGAAEQTQAPNSAPVAAESQSVSAEVPAPKAPEAAPEIDPGAGFNFEVLNGLSEQELMDLYFQLDRLRTSTSEDVDEKRNELVAFLDHHMPPAVADAIKYIDLGNGRKVALNRLNNENFRAVLSIIQNKINKIEPQVAPEEAV